jgi:hypothetical protein
MSIPRSHHYLPQFYLDGFRIVRQRGNKSHIWQIEKADNQKYYSSPIEKTGCRRDFHTLDVDKDKPDCKSIEALLTKIESEQSALVKAIWETKRIEAPQIVALATFISLMRHRVPSFAKHIEGSLQGMVLDTFKIMYRAGKFGQPPPELQNDFDTKGIDNSLDVEISNWKVLEYMFQAGLNAESIRLLTEYNYHIYSAPKGKGLLTGDNPVALYHADYDKIRPYGVGLAISGVEVSFPLTADTLILAGRHVTEGSSTASAEEIDEFNRRTIVMSERYIFASSVAEGLPERIRELKDIRAGFVFDKLFHGDGSAFISTFIPVQ